MPGGKRKSLIPNYYAASRDDNSRDRNCFEIQANGGRAHLQSETMSERPAWQLQRSTDVCGH